MVLEAYKQNAVKDCLLYTGHFIVVLRITSCLSLARIAIFNPQQFQNTMFRKKDSSPVLLLREQKWAADRGRQSESR